jgi:hypothetical protein
MAEPWSPVPEWIIKADGDWEALETLLTRNSSGLHRAPTRTGREPTGLGPLLHAVEVAEFHQPGRSRDQVDQRV